MAWSFFDAHGRPEEICQYTRVSRENFEMKENISKIVGIKVDKRTIYC